MSPTETSHPYALQPTEDERQRLEIQNALMSRTLGNVQIHAPVELGATGGAVLENGTGSGVWLCDLAKTVPSTTELIGIDINPDLFPSSAAIPANLTFRIASVDSLPVEWTAKFSLVHQRFLFSALRPAQWRAAFGEMYRVLKPGGWIQLFEFDELANMGPVLKTYDRLLQNLLREIGTDGFYPNGYKRWKGMLEEVGFVDIRVTWHSTPVGGWAGRDGVDMRKDLMALNNATREITLKHGGLGVVDGGEEGFKKFTEDLEKEMEEGVTEPQARWLMICAGKPTLSMN